MPTKKPTPTAQNHGSAAMMNDQNIASDVLASEKALMKLYCTGLLEASCPKLRALLQAKYAECATDQFDIFSYLNQRGMYPTEDAPPEKVATEKAKFVQLGKSMK